jgi:hypothetical protein
MTQYVARFSDGSTSPVKVCGSFGGMLIGIAERGDHFMRALFFADDGRHDADPWVESIAPDTDALKRLRGGNETELARKVI